MEGLEDISPMGGLTVIDIRPFVGIANMKGIVKQQSDKLQKGDSDQQYLIFTRVSVDGLAKIDRERDSIGKGTRMTHYTDIDLLIVKLPTAEHESAHSNLAKKVGTTLARMGIEEEFHSVGTTRFYGRNSSKEADSSYRPYSSRPNRADWPTIVFESGLSESLSRLRIDARWWLEESGGAVKIVIIISVKRAPLLQMVQIEKWELGPRTGRRLTLRSALNNFNNNPLNNPVHNPLRHIPMKTQEITVAQNTVTGAPLILDFQKIFLRPAVLPETDIILNAQVLSTWAARIW